MVDATWGDWFVQEEVEATNPESLSIWYLDCNGFILRTSNTTVYIDPYFGRGNPPRLLRMSSVPMDSNDATLCDAVLVTHEHLDHMHPPSYEPLIEGLGAQLYAPSAAYTSPDCTVETVGYEDQYETVESGDVFEVGDLTVHACEANDPDAIEPVSFVIEHENGTFFHGGDTRPTDNFEDLGTEFDIDVGVLAFGSVGRRYYPEEESTKAYHVYMDENQVLEATNDLKLNRLLPSHYGMWKGLDSDPKSLHEHATSYEYPHVIETIKTGDRIRIDSPGIKPLDILDR
jgi:L-ascorbate 6-phosphate lactonase